MDLSLSNHWTGQLPDGHWIKVARDDSEQAASEIATEIIVAHALNRQIEPCTYQGRPAFIAPHYGDPISACAPSCLVEILRLADHPAPAGLRPVGDLRQIVADRIRDRVNSPSITTILMRRLERIDLGALAGDRLQHTDPHPGNWVSDDDTGRLTLIDFESARAGDRHVDLGAFAHSCLVKSDESMAEVTRCHADDRVRFDAALAIKTVTAASWLWRAENAAGRDADAAVHQRLALIDAWA